MWTSHEIRNRLEGLKDKFHFGLPQMQTLLCQERFLLRLYQLREGKNYIWKGGSLLVRRYQPTNQKLECLSNTDSCQVSGNALKSGEPERRDRVC